SGSVDNTIKLWSITDGRCLKTLKGHEDWVRSVSFSPDGSLLASGSNDHTIKLWLVSDGRLVRTLIGHSKGVESVSFSPVGSILASGSNDHTIKLWSITDGRCLKTLEGHSKNVNSVSVSPDGSLLASGSDDNTIKLWIRELIRGLPPNLLAELNFEDWNGNGILEANESATIEIAITNKGKGPAHRLEVVVEDDHHDTALALGKQKINRLDPDKSFEVTILLTAGIDLKSAEHRLKINVLEYFGYDMDPAYLLLSTQAYQPPQLVFSGIDIVDWGDETGAIVEDGQLQAGELVKTNLVVQNIGQRASENTTYTVTSTDPNIYISEGSGFLGYIETGEVKEFWVTISPNKRVTTTEKLPIYLTLTESVGKGNLENFQLPIRLNQKPPETKVVEVKPDIERIQRQIARFEYKSSKFKTRVKLVEDIWVVQSSRTRRPNSVAVVIGVEHYKHLPPAPYAVKDAELMEKHFKERLGVDEVVIYREDEVTGLVFDDLFNPDYGELQKVVVKGETELFVYYSGHGLPNKDGSEVYLFPSDGKVEQLEKLGYSLKKFYENLSLLGARHTTVILDACFSGGSRSSSMIKAENLVAHKAVGLRIKEPWRQYPNFTIINSSTGAETSLGFDQSKTGLFTYYLALGLQGKADTDGNRSITLGELKAYVIENVVNTSKKISGVQTPQFYGPDDQVLVEW
ncbi:caspase family protein, partial [bacterium]|nr:caspase family protein [bacterium]